MSEDWTRLSAAIRTARKARGWTQHQLAEKAGIGFSTVQRLEGGAPFTRRPPSLDRIERALGWQLGSADAVLAGGDPEPTGSVDAAVPREAGDVGAPRRSGSPAGSSTSWPAARFWTPRSSSSAIAGSA